jgi:hypothetical protein
MIFGSWHFLEGGGVTRPMWDCAERHHATTDPQQWEKLRIVGLIGDVGDFHEAED